MDVETARRINNKLVATYFVWKGIAPASCRPPSLAGISLAQALEASRIIGTQPPREVPPGQMAVFENFVAPVEVPRLLIWSVLYLQTIPAPE